MTAHDRLWQIQRDLMDTRERLRALAYKIETVGIVYDRLQKIEDDIGRVMTALRNQETVTQ
jgi:hypothetical protein